LCPGQAVPREWMRHVKQVAGWPRKKSTTYARPVMHHVHTPREQHAPVTHRVHTPRDATRTQAQQHAPVTHRHTHSHVPRTHAQQLAGVVLRFPNGHPGAPRSPQCERFSPPPPHRLPFSVHQASGTLQDYCKQRGVGTRQRPGDGEGIPLDVLLHVFTGPARGLEYLHSLSPPVHHRDLKADNLFVFLGPDGRLADVKVGDLSVSKVGPPVA
jgi:hypothetical protein